MNFPPATRASTVPNQGLERGVAAPAPVKIASAESELGLTDGTPGKQPENFNRVATIRTDGSGRREHTQKLRKRRPNEGTARGLWGLRDTLKENAHLGAGNELYFSDVPPSNEDDILLVVPIPIFGANYRQFVGSVR